MKSIIILSIFVCGLVHAQDQAKSGGNDASKKAAPQQVSMDDLWTDQICGGNAAYKADEKKFQDCKDWQSQSAMADQMWADQLCGGNAAYQKDAPKFDKCQKAELEKGRTARLKAEEKCGGIDAYQADKVKFRACKQKNMK